MRGIGETLEGLVPARRRERDVTFLLESFAQRLAQVLFVLDDEHAARFPPGWRVPSSVEGTRDADSEGGARLGLGGDLDGAAVGLRDLLANEEPEAQAVRFRVRRDALAKRVEERR